MLALDDLHAVANPSCMDMLAELAQYVPGGSQIAVTSREEPALPLARWRASGQVQEIGVADLRLDESRRRRYCWKLPESSSMRASCPT